MCERENGTTFSAFSPVQDSLFSVNCQHLRERNILICIENGPSKPIFYRNSIRFIQNCEFYVLPPLMTLVN